MAESKRGGRKSTKATRDPIERLTPLNLVVHASAAFVGAPVLFVLAYFLWMGQFGGTEQNQHLFLGAVCILIGLFLLLLSGLRVWEHVRARRRFDELLAGERKSSVVQNLDELTRLARALGPRHRRRLDERLGELKLKR